MTVWQDVLQRVWGGAACRGDTRW